MVNKCLICGSKKITVWETEMYDDRYGYPGYFSILKCGDCGYLRLDPIIPKDEIPELYEKYYPLSLTTKEDLLKQIKKKTPVILKWLYGVNNVAHEYVTPRTKVLDVGSASGISLLEIEKIGAEAYGVEPDFNGKKLGDELGLRVSCGEVYDKPFENVVFDTITASQVIEHVEEPDLFLEEINSRLKRYGQVILSFPNSGSIFRMIFGKKWINWHIPYHINHFNRTNFNRLANKCGFKIIKSSTITPNLWTIIQLRALMDDVKMGSKSATWSTSKNVGKMDNKNFLRNRLFLTISRILFYLLIPVNRLIDRLGYGDSLLVFLEKDG